MAGRSQVAERIEQAWLSTPSLQTLLNLLNSGEGEARIVGGAVRNALLKQPISDVDVATNLVPKDAISRLAAAGHKSVPTGFDHGTITAIVEGDAYEVTTLRQDVETYGRHASVAYGTDWEADARRRDFTINALYLDADGTIFDPLGAMDDIRTRTVRFIDDAETRIREDYLRILRFFRFFAWYGQHRPDAEGLKACARLKQGIAGLSGERIWQEMVKLLSAPDPCRAMLWMRQTGVLSAVLPESEKWGIDTLPRLIVAEQKGNWQVDPLLRLMAIVPPSQGTINKMADRLRLSNRDRKRLLGWAASDEPKPDLDQVRFFRWLYGQDLQGAGDRLRLAIARSNGDGASYGRQLGWSEDWHRPEFPLRGQHLLDFGMQAGPEISRTLSRLEKHWVESDFKLKREELLDLI